MFSSVLRENEVCQASYASRPNHTIYIEHDNEHYFEETEEKVVSVQSVLRNDHLIFLLKNALLENYGATHTILFMNVWAPNYRMTTGPHQIYNIISAIWNIKWNIMN